MRIAQESLNKILIYHLILYGTIILTILLCMFKKTEVKSPKMPKSKKKKSWMRWNSKEYFPVYAALILFIILLCDIIAFVPFVEDYCKKDIIVKSGYYENKTGGTTRSVGSFIGIYAVKLKTEEGEQLVLTTTPGMHDTFITGQYYVNAYYAPRSEYLLYMEIIE